MPRGTNRYDEARHQGRLWSPIDWRGSTLRGWFDADDLGTLTGASGKCSQWNDKSGLGNDLTQGTSGNQPSIVQTGSNKAFLRFVSANSTFMRKTTLTGWTAPAPSSIFIALKMNSSGNFGFVDLSANTATNNGCLFFFEPSLLQCRIATSGGAGTSATIAFSDTSSWHVVGCNNTVTDENVVLDGVVGTSNATGSFATPANMNVGSLFSNVYYSDADFGEIVITNSFLSTRERNLVEGYLAWKWGTVANLVASHPFRNRPPLIGD